VINDAQRGLVRAIDELLPGAAWQDAGSNSPATPRLWCPRASASVVATAIRSILEQPSDISAAEQLRRVVAGLDHCFPAAAALLREAT
jgi:transposase-like protein